MCTWVVSVESPPLPIRAALLKALQAQLGLQLIPDPSAGDNLACLLHRLKALAKSRHHAALLAGPWILETPTNPHLKALHADLGRAVARTLHLPPLRHLMVCLDACADEAFEHALSDPDAAGRDAGRDATLSQLREAQARVRAASAADTPFEGHVLRFACERFACDNPRAAAKLLDDVCAQCQRVIAQRRD